MIRAGCLRLAADAGNLRGGYVWDSPLTIVVMIGYSRCGSSVFAIVDGANEVEVRAGAFDGAPTDLSPTYELWAPRRERWLVAVANAEQHTGNRT